MSKFRDALPAIGLFFSLIPLAGYEVGRHRWSMLSDEPAVALASVAAAVVTWIIYFCVRRRGASPSA